MQIEVFQNSIKSHQIFGLLLQVHCRPELSKIAQSGHTVLGTISNRSFLKIFQIFLAEKMFWARTRDA